MNLNQLFAAIRKIGGGKLSTADVESINAALEGRALPDTPEGPESGEQPVRTGAAGQRLIKDFEGFAKLLPDGRVQAYPDPATGGKPYTIGYGNTRIDGEAIAPGTIVTRAKAEALFREELAAFEGRVAKLIGDAPTSPAQFDAMMSFAWNLGTGAFGKSTLLRKHKAGNFSGAANEFRRWDKANGRVMRGLTRRREAEAALYREGF